MIFRSACFLLMLSFSFMIITGCGGSKPPMEGTKQLLSGEKIPSWVNNPQKESDKKRKAFVGISRQFAMEQQARNDARLDAYKQAIDDMGAYGERKIYQVVSEMGMSNDIVNPGIVQDEMTRLRSRGIAMGEITEVHVQHWTKYDAGRWRDYYVVRCLFLMPREAVKQFMEDVLKKQADIAEAEKERANLMRAIDKMKEFQAEDW